MLQTTGRVKFSGKVAPQLAGRGMQELPGLSGEIALTNLKLNQLLIAQQLSGTLDVTPAGLQVSGVMFSPAYDLLWTF
jgi:hypothetical protein